MDPKIELFLDDSQTRVKGIDNFVVESLQKEGDLLKITVTFTVKDGSKIPRDAG